MRLVLRQLRPAVLVMVVFTALLGLVYPVVVTGIGQLAFGDEADGSLIEADGRVVGSRLLGQNFGAPQYFHGRPSAAGSGYDASASSGSNLGATSSDLLDAVEQRAVAYRDLNGLAPGAPVPVDAVTASGSGLDPAISVANARLQAARVATERDLPLTTVLELVDDHTTGRALGVLGEPAVQVLPLNLALDTLAP